MKRLRLLLFICLFIFLGFMPSKTVQAGTIYLSDLQEHEEGYIIVGESHIVLTADAYSRAVDSNFKLPGLEDISYHFVLDTSQYVDDNGGSNTFIMQGNLFFILEGNASSDAEKQKSADYIYSDGNGFKGIAVQKIHNIIDTNPNVKHWNIISYHGAISALQGRDAGKYYVESYRNWISHEFPNASIYFVSHSTMTKFYKQNRNAYQFDLEIQKAFPIQYFNMTGFYKARYPEHMYDPQMNPDTIHWSHDTYVELFNYVLSRIQSKAYTDKCRLYREHVFYSTMQTYANKNCCL